MTNKVYSEDIKAAIRVSAEFTPEIATNVFRLTKKQKADVVSGNSSHYTSVNAPCSKVGNGTRRGRPACLTPRMVAAAAALNYMGMTHNEIAQLFGCDNTTVTKRLANYHGYAK